MSYPTLIRFKKQGRPQPHKDKLFYGKPMNGEHAVITADDANHSRQRKILSHAFSDKALKEQEPLLKRWASLMSKKLGEHAESGQKVDMLKYYNCKHCIVYQTDLRHLLMFILRYDF